MKYRLLTALLLLCSCGPSSRDSSTLRVSVLRGPSALVFAEWLAHPPVIDGRTVEVEIADSPQQIEAALIKGETDLAALPLVSAANLYNKGVPYRLSGCPIWGTLYLAGRTEAESLHLFGAGTTPDILTRYYLGRHSRQYALNYTFSTPQEIVQGILAGRVQAAVLSEPFLSMVLQKDTTFRILADLNRPAETIEGFPQTAVVCHPDLKNNYSLIDSLLEKSCRYVNRHPLEAIRTMEEKGIFPNDLVAPATIERCKIRYVPARQAEEDVFSFLRLIGEYEPKAIGGKLPDRSFIVR